MGEQSTVWTARVSFDVWIDAKDVVEVNEAVNDFLDQIGNVDTQAVGWDNCEWSITDPNGVEYQLEGK
jgi:hypothetical protein